MSGFSVALLALPQSMAYALIMGLPLHTGILAVVLGTLITSIFAHTKHLISGPTNASVLLVQAGTSYIYYQHFHGLPSEQKTGMILLILSHITLFMGLIQGAIALLKLGSFTRFISRSVMMGYLIGVSLSIWISQSFHILGLHRPTGAFALYEYIFYLFKPIKIEQLGTLCTALMTLVGLAWLKRKKPHFPRALIMLLGISIFMAVFNFYLPGTFFEHLDYVQTPTIEFTRLFHYRFFLFSRAILQDILIVSFAIALFSIFEVHSVSRLLSAKSGQPPHANRDILSLSLSNLVSSFFLGTLPSSGSPSRSMLNIQSGAKSRWSGIFSSLIVLLLLGLLFPFMPHIPTAALAALMVMIGYEIIDFKLLKICLRATKRDALVLVVTCLSCIFFQLDIALFIGIALSLILYLRLASQTNLSEYIFTQEGHFQPIVKTNERLEKRIRILSMEGDLFFGSVDSLQKGLQSVIKDPDVRILILRLSRVKHLDASICHFLEIFASNLAKEGKSLYLCEMIRTTSQVVYESPLLKKLGQEYLYERDPSSPIKATEMAFAHALNKLNSESKTSS